jgi:hypothetical protein
MSSFKGLDLFGSGPHAFRVHGVGLREATEALPGADGVRVTALGVGPRRIDQAGRLFADRVDELQAQLDRIEAAMDGEAGELVDDLGRRFDHVLMLAFDPGPVRRAAARLSASYQVRYLQVQP